MEKVYEVQVTVHDTQDVNERGRMSYTLLNTQESDGGPTTEQLYAIREEAVRQFREIYPRGANPGGVLPVDIVVSESMTPEQIIRFNEADETAEHYDKARDLLEKSYRAMVHGTRHARDLMAEEVADFLGIDH
jgi:hypothetical protein